MFSRAALLSTLATSIIAEHHPALEVLNVAYMFRAEAEIKDGKAIPGRTHKVPDRDYALHGFDFVVTIAKDAWDALKAEHQYALLDHFISYMGIRFVKVGDSWKPDTDPETGRVRTYKREPDVHEFESVIARHGAYTNEIRSLLRAFAERRIVEKAAAANEKKGRKTEDPAEVDLTADAAEEAPAAETGSGFGTYA